MPGAKMFLDTNVLIYAYDVSAGERREKAGKILVDLWEFGRTFSAPRFYRNFL